MIKKVLVATVFTCCFQQLSAQDSLSTSMNFDTASLTQQIMATNKKSFFQKQGVQMAIAPALFFSASAATWGERREIRKLRNRYIPNFKVPYDDYLQYAPAVAVYGLKVAGVKGRNNTKRATISYAASLAIMGIIVNTVKYTAKVERPDGSSNNSFPSGHTSMAFTNATFLHKEYGLVNPAYSIGGYASSTFTGVGRNLNNRHWISDVLAGAGIGILSVELGYFFIDKFYKNKGDNLGVLSRFEGNGHPSFLSLKVGTALATTDFLKESDLDNKKERGFEAGLEGAYFFSPNWGVGAHFTFNSFQVSPIPFDLDQQLATDIEVDTQSLGFINIGIGPYYAYDFSNRWQLMLKTTAGYAGGSAGKVFFQSEEFNDLPDNQFEVAHYKPSSSFRWHSGVSMTYKFSDELGVTTYADYTHTNSKITYTFNEILKHSQDMNNSFNDVSAKEKINYVSLGLKLTAFF